MLLLHSYQFGSGYISSAVSFVCAYSQRKLYRIMLLNHLVFAQAAVWVPNSC